MQNFKPVLIIIDRKETKLLPSRINTPTTHRHYSESEEGRAIKIQNQQVGTSDHYILNIEIALRGTTKISVLKTLHFSRSRFALPNLIKLSLTSVAKSQLLTGAHRSDCEGHSGPTSLAPSSIVLFVKDILAS